MTSEDKFDSIVGYRAQNYQGAKATHCHYKGIVEKSDLVILDEATSALDSESEKQIFNNLRDIYKGKTMILVSHHLSSIKEVDEIICMERGRWLSRVCMKR